MQTEKYSISNCRLCWNALPGNRENPTSSCCAACTDTAACRFLRQAGDDVSSNPLLDPGMDRAAKNGSAGERRAEGILFCRAIRRRSDIDSLSGSDGFVGGFMQFPSVCPEIPVSSLPPALAYYRDQLGFNIDWSDEQLGLACLSRGDDSDVHDQRRVSIGPRYPRADGPVAEFCPTAPRLTRSTRNGPRPGPELQTLQRRSLTTSSTNSLPRTSTGITFACFTTLLGRRGETRACEA